MRENTKAYVSTYFIYKLKFFKYCLIKPKIIMKNQPIVN